MTNDGWDEDIDARFDDIMSHWDEPAAGTANGPGAHHDKGINPPPVTGFGPSRGPHHPAHEADAGEPEPDDGRGPPDEEPSPQEPGPGAEGWRTHDAPEEDEHFVPPPPAPLPAGDLQFWGILVGLVGGPGLLLYLIMFDREASSLWIALAIALSLGGFGILVARLPSHRDDDGDDGARV